MKKLIVILLPFVGVAFAGAPVALSNTICQGLQAALANSAKSGASDAAIANKLASFANMNVADVPLFPMVCKSVLDDVYDKMLAGKIDKESITAANQKLKNLFTCPGYICVGLLPTMIEIIDRVALPLPGSLALLGGAVKNSAKNVLTSVDNYLQGLYKSQPLMLNACAIGLGKAMSKPINVAASKRSITLWKPETGNIMTDSLACVPPDIMEKYMPKSKAEDAPHISEEELAELF